MNVKVQKYSENGINLSKVKICEGDEITLNYNGILMQSGADILYVHLGYGESWEEKLLLPMIFEDGIFKTVFKVNKVGMLNVCFKDSANNWDNNSGENYTFKITKKAATPKSTVKKKSVPKTVKSSEVIAASSKKKC